MKNKLYNILILLSITIITSCTANYAAHQYPNQSLLGYNPADTTNIENLYHMDKRGNISKMPKNYNAPPATQKIDHFAPAMSSMPPRNQQMNMGYNPTNTRQPNSHIQPPQQARTYKTNYSHARMPNPSHLQQNRRYPALNNYPYPYKTNQPARQAIKQPAPQKQNRYSNFNPQLNEPKDNFPEITNAYNPYQPRNNNNYRSNYLSSKNKKHLGLIDGDYFKAGSNRAINYDKNLGYNYEISKYRQNNIVIDAVDNNILDGMIRNDSLTNGFKLKSLPSY